MLNPWSAVQTVATFALASFIGVFIAQLIIARRSAQRALFLFKPLIKSSNLPEQLSLPAALGIVDAKAEHSIVSSLLRSNAISETEVLIYNLVTEPLGFIYALRFLIPMVIAPLGLSVGGICIALLLIRSVIGFLVGLACGKLLLKTRSAVLEISIQAPITGKNISRRDIANAARKALSMTLYFLKRYVIILAILYVLDYFRVFSYTATVVRQLKFPIPLTPQALSILVTHAVSPTSGYILAGELLRQGGCNCT